MTTPTQTPPDTTLNSLIQEFRHFKQETNNRLLRNLRERQDPLLYALLGGAIAICGSVLGVGIAIALRI